MNVFSFFSIFFCYLTDQTWRQTKTNPHHDSSSFSFLQPSTLHDCSSQTLPRLCSREAGLCSARNFKVCAPSCFSCRPSLPLFVFSLPCFHCSINISPFPAPFLSLSSSVSHHLICFLLPPCLPLFFFLPFPNPHLSLSESHQSRDIKGTSPPLLLSRADRFHAKARYPQGRMQNSVETHCTISKRECVKKVKTHIRIYFILGGMYGVMVKCV